MAEDLGLFLAYGGLHVRTSGLARIVVSVPKLHRRSRNHDMKYLPGYKKLAYKRDVMACVLRFA